MDVAPTSANLDISRIENLSIYVNPEFGLCHEDPSFESDSTSLESNHAMSHLIKNPHFPHIFPFPLWDVLVHFIIQKGFLISY